jgi:5'-nucleotidase
LTGFLEEDDRETDADQWAVTHRYISVTPIQYDLTDYSLIERIEEWGIERLK